VSITGERTETRTAYWARALENRDTFETACRESVVAEPTWATVLGGLRIRPDPDDVSITPWLRKDGFWESWVSLAMARVIQPDWHCVDVGANVGYYSLLMLDRSGPTGHVFAIEPQPWCINALVASAAENGFSKRLHAFQGVAGSSAGEHDLLLYGPLGGSASLYPALGYEPTGTLQTQMAPLDALLADWPRLDFAKIDVEGAEVEVWEGMRYLRQWWPHLIITMEVASNRHYDLSAFLARIEIEGYPLRAISGDGQILDRAKEEIVGFGEELPLLWLQRA